MPNRVKSSISHLARTTLEVILTYLFSSSRNDKYTFLKVQSGFVDLYLRVTPAFGRHNLETSWLVATRDDFRATWPVTGQPRSPARAFSQANTTIPKSEYNIAPSLNKIQHTQHRTLHSLAKVCRRVKRATYKPQLRWPIQPLISADRISLLHWYSTKVSVKLTKLRINGLPTMELPGFLSLNDCELLLIVSLPCLGKHSKYETPPTEPSFFPMGVSSSTPAHTPEAKSVGPQKRRIPNWNQNIHNNLVSLRLTHWFMLYNFSLMMDHRKLTPFSTKSPFYWHVQLLIHTVEPTKTWRVNCRLRESNCRRTCMRRSPDTSFRR